MDHRIEGEIHHLEVQKHLEEVRKWSYQDPVVVILHKSGVQYLKRKEMSEIKMIKIYLKSTYLFYCPSLKPPRSYRQNNPNLNYAIILP
jgi:hypothetical protein